MLYLLFLIKVVLLCLSNQGIVALLYLFADFPLIYIDLISWLNLTHRNRDVVSCVSINEEFPSGNKS